MPTESGDGNLHLNLDQAKRLVASETASPGIRTLGCLTAAVLFLNQPGATSDSATLDVLEGLLEAVQSRIDEMRFEEFGRHGG